MDEKERIRQKQNANLIPVKKGGAAPPGAGGVKGIRHWSTVFREVLALPPEDIEEFIGKRLPEHLRNRAMQQIIALKVMVKALSGDLNAVDRLMDRMDGKPKETVSVDQPEGINIDSLPDELRKEVLTELLKQAEQKK